MARRSKTVCERFTRASNTLNGPTSPGTPGGNGNPKAARFTFCRFSKTRPPTFGRRSASAVHFVPCERATASSAFSNPRLCSRERVMAPSIVSAIGSAVAVPVGTPPKKGDVWRLVWLRDAPDEDAGGWAFTGAMATAEDSSRTAAGRANFNSDPFSPDAELDERGAGEGSRSRRGRQARRLESIASSKRTTRNRLRSCFVR